MPNGVYNVDNAINVASCVANAGGTLVARVKYVVVTSSVLVKYRGVR